MADLTPAELHARAHLLDFTTYTYPGYEVNWHHRLLCEHLDNFATGRDQRLMIFVQPRSGKSELVSRRLPAFILGRDPDAWIIAASYGADLARRMNRDVQRIIDSPEYRRLFPDTQLWGKNVRSVADGSFLRNSDLFEVVGHKGYYMGVGVGGALTGMGGKYLLIDDPVKNRAQANSATYRQAVEEWYTSTFYTRLAPGGNILLVQCMTGSTQVLMADGTERPLREIKVGDRVATYDNGRLATSIVRNHKSNHLDFIFRIKTTCGKIVHANERHPFLVEEHGQLKWMRLRSLTTAHKIVALKDSGVNGKARHASLRDARIPSARVVTASITTPKNCGQTGIAPQRSIQSIAGTCASSSGTESPPQNMMLCTKRKTASAPFAVSHQGIMCERTGAENCVSITATKRTRLGHYCATTATLRLGTPRQKQPHALWSNTSDFTTAQIESIEPAGVEEVFDIQIERTENFIANGLVSHNTRWHEDDLAGRLLERAKSDPDADQWTVITLPAIAEEPVAPYDPRLPGEVLWPQRWDAKEMRRKRAVVGERDWASLYQQRPSPDEGEIFKRHHWRYWQPKGANLPPVTVTMADSSVIQVEAVELPARFDEMLQSWDCTFKDTATSDFVAGQVLGRLGADKFLLDYICERLGIVATMDAILAWRIKWPKAIAILIEDKANGPAVIQMLHNKIAGLIAVEPKGGKESRAYAAAPEVESGNVYLPHPLIAPWVERFIGSAASFPNGAHDDDVDAFTQAIIRWQEAGQVATAPAQVTSQATIQEMFG